MPRSLWKRGWLIFAFWTLIGLFFSTHSYLLTARFLDPNVNFAYAFIDTMPEWYVWAALTPLIFRLACRFPLERATWRRALPIHVALGCFLVVLHTLLSVTLVMLLWWVVGRKIAWAAVAQDKLALFFHWNVLTYAALVATIQAFNYYRQSRDREQKALQLEARLARAQLDALKSQLHPHFLFNALNGIAELIHEDPGVAEKMLLRLSDLLRTTLGKADAQEVPLRQELEFIKTYLEIEQIRFQDRLTVGWEVDPALLLAPVPNLVLQPLVENALRHGIGPCAGRGKVTIRAIPDGAGLRLEVSDTGRGVEWNCRDEIREGLGLSNTRARLQRLYGSNGGLELQNANGGGTVAVVTIPLHIQAGQGAGQGGNGPC